jgi:HEAT repeat protein
MSDERLDRNLSRLLGAAPRAHSPEPAFREQLREHLLKEADRLRAKPPVERWRFQRWLAAGTALAVAASIVILLLPRTVRLSAAEPLALRLAAGAARSIKLGRVAALEVRGPATLHWSTPTLRLEHGYVKLRAHQPLRVLADGAELELSDDGSCEVELRREGEPNMKRWLLPATATAAAGGVVLAILLHNGTLSLRRANAAQRAVGNGELVVMQGRATDDAAKLAQAEHRISLLERKLSTAQDQANRLAAQLVEKKGVTVADALKRVGELRKAGIGALAAPGKLADLVSDLKGLGPAGVNAMMDLLKSKDPKERFLAAKVLEDLSSPASISALREAALGDTDPMAANMAAHALALMGDPATTDALRDVVKGNKSWQQVVNGLWGLCNIGDTDGLAQALAYIKNPQIDAGARTALAANLTLINDESVMPMVDEMLRQSGDNAQIDLLAVNYYKQLGTPDALQRLASIADDARLPQAARDAARAALQK